MNVIQNPIRGKGLKNFHTICPGNVIDDHSGVIKLLPNCKENPFRCKAKINRSFEVKEPCF